jgi:hypothetical protein
MLIINDKGVRPLQFKFEVRCTTDDWRIVTLRIEVSARRTVQTTGIVEEKEYKIRRAVKAAIKCTADGATWGDWHRKVWHCPEGQCNMPVEKPREALARKLLD